jgi:UDP-3-O-acyl N-acetylglucosamine deacetylase
MEKRVRKRPFRTIKRSVTFRGVGVHTGIDTAVTLHPSEGRTVFSKKGKETILIGASIDNVLDTVHGTSIGNGAVTFRMVEHLLGALYAQQIDGVHVVVENGDEIPILDGSALPVVQSLKKAGTMQRDGIEATEDVRIEAPFQVSVGGSFLGVYPASQCAVTYFISYQEYPELTQLKTVIVEPRVFEKEIAPARTFAFMEWVEPLQKKGLIKGGSLENSLVYSKEGFLNPGPLRFEDELVRHKILDFLGDLALLEKRIQGHFIIVCGGHTAHIAFLNGLKRELGIVSRDARVSE